MVSAIERFHFILKSSLEILMEINSYGVSTYMVMLYLFLRWGFSKFYKISSCNIFSYNFNRTN